VNVFTRHLLNKGHNIKLYDIDCSRSRALAEEYDCQWLDSIATAVSGVDMTLLCTPIKETPGVIRDIASNIRQGSILCEVSSLKMRTVAALKKLGDHVRSLSIHPMFGPDVSTFQGQTMVVVPVSDRDEEVALVESLFGDMNILVADVETHDRVMASVLALPYFMNLAFASTLSVKDLSLMREMAGTTFTVQLAVAQSIVGESPELIESIINEDVFSMGFVNRFIDECRHLRRLLKKGPRAMGRLCEGLRERMMDDVEYGDARRIRNEFLISLRTQSPAVEKRLG
jgi:prephenate dehydrogenase